MIAVISPLKTLLRNSKYLLFGTILLLGVLVVFYEMAETESWGLNPYTDDNSWWRAMVDKVFSEDHQTDPVNVLDDRRSNYTPPTWKPEFKGRANLHAFEDWCGTSTAALRKNGHFPLYPHTRTTVKKLAISPKWSNYGLRIFGYLHPHTNGEFVFAVSSEDNSEFWLSSDDSPLNVKLLAWVGKTGTEWAVPGEFGKYASQTSGSIMLSSQRRYFFEVLFVQDDKGTGHVEVAWKLLNQDFGFTIIDSKHISLFASESGLLPSDVSTIPQTAASHHHILSKQPGATADMLREDPRDTFYRVPLVSSNFLKGVLADCSYEPSYTLKGVHLPLYQGALTVRYSYIYPNDYTRLTHMELDENCFYPEHPSDMKTNRFSKYMIPDGPEEKSTTGVYFANPLQDEQEDSDLKGVKSVLNDAKDHVVRRRKSVSDYKKDFPVKRKKSVLDDAEYFPVRRRKSVFDDKKDFGFQRRRSVFDGEEDFGFRRRKSVPEIWSGLRNNPLFPNTYTRKHLWEKEIEKNMPLQLDLEMSSPTAMRGKMRKKRSEEEEKNALPVVNWNDTFQVSYQDFQALRSHHVNFGCNLVGNVQLSSSETLPLVKAFMDRLEAKRPGLFRLGRVINVVKRVDEVRGSRYLLELEVIDASGKLLRLSHYIYNLNRSGRRRRRDTTVKELKPPPLLCNPVDFQWNPAATVHIIVPVKNQARWVQQLITEMERLFKETQDTNFNLIITDYSSSDMDVKKALEKSSLHRYDYLKLSGNFERSAGLQAGVDLIKEKHSIVFLCDLHLHFPSNIIDAIRTHCVEGYMVFAPVVMRLDCGAAPFDARGFWELDGFGLLGIYKSDLEAVGGMNTEKFKDTWGGEDVELIDRILEGGLEVERIHLRNFYHNFHSKRGMWVTQVS
ncbi:N-acetyl-beta-glucosaminyl-glycoprotein 4-beta-N-acetylgalactosaminyltransferase 1-like [Sparus aurata]|uniref:N-acetyl-beta-glucosaminyl-glycoprotein 4-beta-N-acetylgalactosaminyltransferase 1-like n=1 Tax=Sparus aurata TaxID=8175 RepID=UPI0011C14602|nr:N-acetyl-beta-glucosaminyl-glycoprotein 4-beta-N-acetylgalactosaminyltransferase 1-like [Sparus aurata]